MLEPNYIGFLFVPEIINFESERGCMTVMRIQKNDESKRDQLAFQWCRRAIHAIRLCSSAHSLQRTLSMHHHHTLLETRSLLLFKSERFDDINAELDSIDAELAAEYFENSIIPIGKTDISIAKKRAIGNNGYVASMSLKYILMETLKNDYTCEYSAINQAIAASTDRSLIHTNRTIAICPLNRCSIRRRNFKFVSAVRHSEPNGKFVQRIIICLSAAVATTQLYPICFFYLLNAVFSIQKISICCCVGRP